MGMQLTLLTADRHEQLFTRLSALVRQVEAVAGRRPDAGVPEAMRVMAEGLLFDARPFLKTHPGRRLPAAAPGYGLLAAQLGQALAGLVDYETRHSMWSTALEAFVWIIALGEPRLVRRLRPSVAMTVAKKSDPEMPSIRRELVRRLESLTRDLPQWFYDPSHPDYEMMTHKLADFVAQEAMVRQQMHAVEPEADDAERDDDALLDDENGESLERYQTYPRARSLD